MPPGAEDSEKVPFWAMAGCASPIKTKTRKMRARGHVLRDAPHTFPPDLTTGRCVRRRSSWSLTLIFPYNDRATTATQSRSCRLLDCQSKRNGGGLRARHAGAVGWRYRHADKARLCGAAGRIGYDGVWCRGAYGSK